MSDWRIFFLAETGSTNDDARLLADQYAGEFVVWAHNQTAGRGRENRVWHSTENDSLTFTVLFRPTAKEGQFLTQFTALGALAITDVLINQYSLTAEIKWPNDVLVGRKKVSGILAESVWNGSQLDGLALGIGINLSDEAYADEAKLRFPATSLKSEGIDLQSRQDFMEKILLAIQEWRRQVGSELFMEEWNQRLAFRGEFLSFKQYLGKTKLLCPVSINPDGSLNVRDRAGNRLTVQSAETSSSSASSPSVPASG
ncbi:MAG: biotin--[acetyl-CoA-carboxylase] ligase [Chloroflexi bacterium]|nr:biotin--[acetyl-CoA-carboxylase] ligase [Chloroflexota bacterium]